MRKQEKRKGVSIVAQLNQRLSIPQSGERQGDGSEPRRAPVRQFIAIIGGGPKGTYALERLVAQLKAEPVADPVEIHVFNRTAHFGAGEIYDPAQPEYLLINYAIGNINMWSDEAPPAVVPHPLPLTVWLREAHNPPLAVNELSYVSRATVGRYLEAGFDAIVAHAPPNVTVRRIVGEVADLQAMGHQYRITLRTQDGTLHRLAPAYGHLLLATGHPRNKLDRASATYRRFADAHTSAEFVPFIYPVESALTTLPAAQRIAMKGMGLTFVDGVLALTEGKGGNFIRDGATDTLAYHSSGAEPQVIYPFSRSGLPMIPRGPAYGASPTEPRFFTKDAIAALQTTAANAQRKLSFAEDIWPLVIQEMTFAYYRVQLAISGEPLTAAEQESFATLEQAIDDYHERHPAHERFTPLKPLDPAAGQEWSTPDAYHAFILDYLRFMIAEARKGETGSPWMAAAAVWRVATPLFGSLLEFGGLSAGGHRLFLQQYASTLARVSFGPPIESMEKLVAVADAGILRFDLARGGDITIDENRGLFCLHSMTVAAEQPIDCLIDARIPKVSLLDDRATLYQNLLHRGAIRLFQNAGSAPEEQPFYPGSLEIKRNGGFVVSAAGHTNQALAATGTPTEGITYDNDSLSRKRNNFVSSWAARVAATIRKRCAAAGKQEAAQAPDDTETKVFA